LVFTKRLKAELDFKDTIFLWDSQNAVIFSMDTAIIRVNSPVEKMHAQQRILY